MSHCFSSLVTIPFERKACLGCRWHSCAAYLCQQTSLLCILVKTEKHGGGGGRLPILSFICSTENLFLWAETMSLLVPRHKSVPVKSLASTSTRQFCLSLYLICADLEGHASYLKNLFWQSRLLSCIRWDNYEKHFLACSPSSLPYVSYAELMLLILGQRLSWIWLEKEIHSDLFSGVF